MMIQDSGMESEWFSDVLVGLRICAQYEVTDGEITEIKFTTPIKGVLVDISNLIPKVTKDILIDAIEGQS